MDETALIDRAIAALGQLGLKVLAMKQPRGAERLQAGAWIRVGREPIDYLVEAKRAVTPATLGAAVAQLRHLAAVAGRPASLVTDYLDATGYIGSAFAL